jgi:hypothetical protein
MIRLGKSFGYCSFRVLIIVDALCQNIDIYDYDKYD